MDADDSKKESSIISPSQLKQSVADTIIVTTSSFQQDSNNRQRYPSNAAKIGNEISIIAKMSVNATAIKVSEEMSEQVMEKLYGLKKALEIAGFNCDSVSTTGMDADNLPETNIEVHNDGTFHHEISTPITQVDSFFNDEVQKESVDKNTIMYVIRM